jgi:hypothetical protein
MTNVREAFVLKTKPILSVKTDRGTVSLYRPIPKTIYTIVSGHLEAKAWKTVSEKMAALITQEPSTIFHDWFDMASYDSEARSYSIEWVKENTHNMELTYVGTKSKIVAMGSQVVGMLIKTNMVVTADPKVFNDAFLARIKR